MGVFGSQTVKIGIPGSETVSRAMVEEMRRSGDRMKEIYRICHIETAVLPYLLTFLAEGRA